MKRVPIVLALALMLLVLLAVPGWGWPPRDNPNQPPDHAAACQYEYGFMFRSTGWLGHHYGLGYLMGNAQGWMLGPVGPDYTACD